MRRSVLLSLALLLLVAAGGEEEPGGEGTIRLGNKVVDVVWTDGDTLTFVAGARKGKSARLVGYNTLESYGPVHRWGDWSSAELYVIAKEAATVAAAERWSCTLGRKSDSYGRLLLDCPGARRALLSSGHAHVFAYAEPADPDDLAAQSSARMDGIGMWAKGTPETLITNVSVTDSGLFLRVVTVRTGETEAKHQQEEYAICDEVCHGPSVNGSCMLFVPWQRRYSDRPECLQEP